IKFQNRTAAHRPRLLQTKVSPTDVGGFQPGASDSGEHSSTSVAKASSLTSRSL
ncbi:unnamed protein product, partial [Boreogadus saida]